jgi:hypothetical protein
MSADCPRPFKILFEMDPDKAPGSVFLMFATVLSSNCFPLILKSGVRPSPRGTISMSFPRSRISLANVFSAGVSLSVLPVILPGPGFLSRKSGLGFVAGACEAAGLAGLAGSAAAGGFAGVGSFGPRPTWVMPLPSPEEKRPALSWLGLNFEAGRSGSAGYPTARRFSASVRKDDFSRRAHSVAGLPPAGRFALGG